MKHAAPHQASRRVSVVKVAAVPVLAAAGLGLLALPALALFTGPLHPALPLHPAHPLHPAQRAGLSADTAAADVADEASACQAWEPVLPGLLYLGTAPVLTIGGVPLLGRGSCLPGSGKGYDIAVGANIALPPQSICDNADAPLPLLKLNLGVAIGVPDEDGSDPCQGAARPATPAQVVPPQVVPPRTPHVVPPHVVPPHVVPPRPPHVVAPRPPRPGPVPSSVLGSPPPRPGPVPSSVLASPPPPRHVPPPPTTPAPPPTTPAAVVPPPKKSPPPRRPQPAPPVSASAVVPVATVAVKPHHKPRPHAKPAPVPPPPFKRAAVAEPPVSTFKPGQPAMPVGVLVTVVVTPCVATVVARLGKAMAGR